MTGLLNKNLLALLALVMGLSFSTHARKQEKGQKAAAVEQSQRAENKLKTISGVVINQKNVKFAGTDEENLVVQVKTAQGEVLVVDLGDADEIISLEEGESKLEVEGAIGQIGSQPFMIAKRVKINGETAKILRTQDPFEKDRDAQAE